MCFCCCSSIRCFMKEEIHSIKSIDEFSAEYRSQHNTSQTRSQTLEIMTQPDSWLVTSILICIEEKMNEYKIQRQGRHEQKFTLSSFLLLSSSIPTFAPFSMRSIIRQSLSLLTSTSSPYIHYLLHLSGTMKNDANSERRRIKVMCHEI